MKIAFFLYHFPVLSETFVLNQITGLVDRGHYVKIFCKSPYTDPFHHSDVDRYHLLDHTFYYQTDGNRLPVNKTFRIKKAVGILLAHLKKKPLPLLKALNVFKFGRMASSLGIFYLTAPFLENSLHEFDVAFCHFAPNGDLAAMLKYLGAFDGKIVTVFHGEAGYTGKKAYRKGYKNLFKHGDLFLPMSDRERQNLINLGCDPRRIVVHKMGIDTGKFAFSPPKPGHNQKIRLLTVGRLFEKKGIEYGIRAVAKVAERHPDVEYSIAGDGPLKDSLQKLTDRLDISDKINMLGYRVHEDIVKLFNDADIFLAPSVTAKDGDIEGIPVVIMEAMARGLPVLSTFHAGIPELVHDGISGFLVPERDPDALADRLAYLVEHPEKCRKMGRAGRHFIENNHDIDQLNDELELMFHQLLEGKKG